MSLDSYSVKEIRDICKINDSSYSKKDNWNFFNYLDTKNITKGEINEIKYLDPSIEKIPSRAKRKVNIDDIIISTVRPNQEHYGMIKYEIDNFLVSTGFTTLTVDKSKAIPEFIYYYITQNHITEALQTIAEQSTTSYPSIRPSDIGDIIINLPSLEIQKGISNILSNIENKIEINKKINRNLFKLSRYLYKEFYMDKVESYDKKEYVTLDDVTSKFATGLNPRKNFVLGEGDNYYVTIKNMANNSIVLDDKCASITDEALVKINKRSDLQVGDLLFSGIGTIGRVHLIDEKPTNWNISESVFTMRPNELISSEFLFIMLLSQEIQEYAKSLASGSVQKGIRMRDLKAFEFILPNDEDKSSLDSLLIPIIADIKSNEKEIKKLTKLRDTLLPKLMSGEIDVSKINCDFENIAHFMIFSFKKIIGYLGLYFIRFL